MRRDVNLLAVRLACAPGAHAGAAVVAHRGRAGCVLTRARRLLDFGVHPGGGVGVAASQPGAAVAPPIERPSPAAEGVARLSGGGSVAVDAGCAGRSPSTSTGSAGLLAFPGTQTTPYRQRVRPSDLPAWAEEQ